VEQVRSFLGFTGYYRRFVQDYAKIARPLNDLLAGYHGKKRLVRRSFVWGEDQQIAFDTLIHHLTSAPVLAYADFTQPFELHIDASGDGLGAILYQQQDGHRRVIAYASRGLSKTERRYPAHKREFLALHWAVVKKFHDYLYGNQFLVTTDNNPVTYVLTTAKLDATGHRWLAALATYNFSLEYVPGPKNVDADVLSRLPRETMAIESVSALCQGHLVSMPAVEILSLNQEVVCGVLTAEESTSVGQPSRSMKEYQHDDESIRIISNHVDSGTRPSVETTRTLDRDTASILRQWDTLVVQENTLKRRQVSSDGEVYYQLVVPKAHRDQVISSLHDDMGHLGRDRTIALIRSRFYWPGMFQDVERRVASCRSCILRKAPNQGERAPLVNIHSCQPMELVCIDYLSLEPSGGYENVLVITDHFTKYALAVPTKNQTAKTTAKVLFNQLVVHYGVPEKIHSDQGRNFESDIIKELCSILGIRKTRTTPYHPMGNGLCERFNRTILGMLGTLESQEKAKWKDHIAHLVHAYNCTLHESTGYTPYFLMFGRHPRLPVDIAYGTTSSSNSSVSHSRFAADLQSKLATAYDLARRNLEKAQEKQRTAYNFKARGATVKVGDIVLVRNVGIRGVNKLANRWEEDFYVVEAQPNPEVPVFSICKQGTQHRKVLHRNLLLPIGTNGRPIPRPRRSCSSVDRNPDSETSALDMSAEPDVSIEPIPVDHSTSGEIEGGLDPSAQESNSEDSSFFEQRIPPTRQRRKPAWMADDQWVINNTIWV
jgi:transposase InsO family protein